MMMEHPAWAGWWSLGVCVAAATLLAALSLVIVPRLSEPETDPDDPFTKPPYRSLITPRFVVVALVLAGVAGSLASLSGALRPPLVVWAGMATLITVDAVTTYLPATLHWLATAQASLALVISGWWLGDLGGLAWRAAVGSVVIGGLFWLLWWLPQRRGRGSPLGYGDVRLMALFGAVVGAGGANFAYLAVLLGTIAGALYGVAVTLWRRRHPSSLGTMFAYGPGLWAGPPLAVGLLAWS